MNERPRVPPATRSLVVLVLVATAAATVAVQRPHTTTVAGRSVAHGSDAVAASPSLAEVGPDAASAQPGRTIATVPSAAARNRVAPACAPGRNGGATDVGVSATTIKLGATVVDSGIGASFLRDARYGMQAVVDDVNRAGGICGRRLDLAMVDDGWDFGRGGDFLRNLVEDNHVFALAVVPSSEGLKNVSDAGYLGRQGVPVVGTDGMLIHQYTDPAIWPVAASTISAMRVMAKHAFDSPAIHARSFGLVYESTYHFGIEGAYAFNAAVKALTGSDISGYANPLTNPGCSKQFCGIRAGKAGYSTEIQEFNSHCGCDFVALLLEPATALTWLKGGGFVRGDGRTAGVQPLFTRDFAVQCGGICDGMWLWSGFLPPIGANLSLPPVARYVDLVRGTSSNVDFANSFVEGAYVGMVTLVEALRQAGPDLTRARLRSVLDSLTVDTGLTASPLHFAAGNHFANVQLQAYSIQYRDRFTGWRDEQVSRADPWVGQPIPRA